MIILTLLLILALWFAVGYVIRNNELPIAIQLLIYIIVIIMTAMLMMVAVIWRKI